MHLSGLFIYPVKSLGGCHVTEAIVDTLGLVGDRRFMVVDESGRFFTQRAFPRMALVRTGLSADTLTLSSDRAGSVSVGRAADANAPLRSVSIWKSEGLLAEDCGDPPAAWLSEFLGAKCRLVRIGAKFLRPILKPAAGPGDVVTFADSVPFLMLSEATLADLNDRLVAKGEEAVPMNRFRPNLVVSGCAAFAEDQWIRFRVGSVTFRSGGPCVRCVVITTDQTTAERSPEPLRALATYRRGNLDPTAVNFGQNLIHETKRGELRVGDEVHLL